MCYYIQIKMWKHICIFKKIDKKIYKNSSIIFVSLLTIIMTSLFYYMSKTQDIMIVYYIKEKLIEIKLKLII